MRLILQVFPEVPWVFLYRDPAEVIVSNIEKVAGWVHSSYVTSEERKKVVGSMEEHLAISLAETMKGAVEFFRPEKSLFVNYATLPRSMEKILKLFQPDVKDMKAALERMQSVNKFHATSSRKVIFTPDIERKQKKISYPIRQAIGKYLGNNESGAYHDLLRLQDMSDDGRASFLTTIGSFTMTSGSSINAIGTDRL